MEQLATFIFGTLLAAVVYAIGYSFLDGYFGFFNIFVAELELSFEHVLVHSMSGISYAIRGWLLSSLIFVLLIYSLAYWALKTSGGGKPDVKNLAIAYCTGAFIFAIMAFLGAQDNGRSHAEASIAHLAWTAPSSELVDLIQDATGETPNRIYSIYNTSDVSYYLHVPRRGRPPWMLRYDRERGTLDRYLLD